MEYTECTGESLKASDHVSWVQTGRHYWNES